MNDQEIFLDANKDALKQIYMTFFNGYVSADNTADEAQAESCLSPASRSLARSRDRALALPL